MALKTFNIDGEIYKIFSEHCKREGISMSKKVEKFIQGEIENLGIKEKNINTRKDFRNGEVEHSFRKYC